MKKKYNQYALEVIERYQEIVILDLYSFVNNNDKFTDWRQGSDLHFHDENAQLVGEEMTNTLKKIIVDLPPK